MITIGLTGGIGSGKTTVTNYLENLGAIIIDADVIAREVVAPGNPALKQILQTFGPDILHANGSLNRKELAALEQLNSIMHPHIQAVVQQKLQYYRVHYPKKILVLVAPLLIEVGLQRMVDSVWVVHVEQAEQIKRVMERDKLSKEQALKRINSQLSAKERLKFADEVINNSYSIENTRQQVLKLWNRYEKGYC
jgi:dephospho-CoA kinase